MVQNRAHGIQCNSFPHSEKFPGHEQESQPGFEKAIAITIAIENRSGKNSKRFSLNYRIAIFPKKSICDFHLQIGSQLKTGSGTASADRT
jgi:hypothetical protein